MFHVNLQGCMPGFGQELQQKQPSPLGFDNIPDAFFYKISARAVRTSRGFLQRKMPRSHGSERRCLFQSSSFPQNWFMLTTKKELKCRDFPFQVLLKRGVNIHFVVIVDGICFPPQKKADFIKPNSTELLEALQDSIKSWWKKSCTSW